ncbi:hypothetical protein Fmac_021085 [Flemingia macrophylla]|uniref:Uncharacterized protein n=1 Tax=Flemingia macrophylla TaxID=520843 RepID=A0ABD1LVT9_9FABA
MSTPRRQEAPYQAPQRVILLFLTSIGQHILLPYLLIKPTHDFAYESTPEVTPEIQSKSEEETTEKKTKQSKHVSRKRSWLVDVIGKIKLVKFEVDFDAHVKYIFKSLNTKWSEYIQQLWKSDDGTRNRDELITMGPERENSKINKDNRKRQTISHTDGSKSIACKKDEMEQELGSKVSRGEVWITTHKHSNGDFVNDETR